MNSQSAKKSTSNKCNCSNSLPGEIADKMLQKIQSVRSKNYQKSQTRSVEHPISHTTEIDHSSKSSGLCTII